jgi:PKD repeat protein
MLKKIAFALAGLTLLASPLVVSAQQFALPTIPPNATVSDLQNLIGQLTQILNQLLSLRVSSASSGTLDVTPKVGLAPLSVTFSSSMTGGTVDFGDGTSGTLNPAPVCASCSAVSIAGHTYTSPGTYKAKLYQQSCNSFAYGGTCPQTAVGSVTVTVIGTSSGSTCSANGSPVCAAGTHLVGAQVFAGCAIGGQCVADTTTTKSATTTTGNASFSATKVSGQSGLSILFSIPWGISNPSVDFGDSTSQLVPPWACGGISNCAGSITHTYNSAGTYTAKLYQQPCISSGSSGSACPQTLVSTVTVVVIVSASSTAALTASPLSGTAPLSVTFSGPFSGATLAFGDGQSGTFSLSQCSQTATIGSTPNCTLTHVYTSAGTYRPSLTVGSQIFAATVLVTGASTPTCSYGGNTTLITDSNACTNWCLSFGAYGAVGRGVGGVPPTFGSSFTGTAGSCVFKDANAVSHTIDPSSPVACPVYQQLLCPSGQQNVNSGNTTDANGCTVPHYSCVSSFFPGAGSAAGTCTFSGNTSLATSATQCSIWCSSFYGGNLPPIGQGQLQFGGQCVYTSSDGSSQIVGIAPGENQNTNLASALSALASALRAFLGQ